MGSLANYIATLFMFIIIPQMQKENLKLLLGGFREWIHEVSNVSKFGGVLVDKQLLPLRMNGKDQVNLCVCVRVTDVSVCK